MPIDPYDPIGNIAQRLGVSRKTAEGYYNQALTTGQEASEEGFRPGGTQDSREWQQSGDKWQRNSSDAVGRDGQSE